MKNTTKHRLVGVVAILLAVVTFSACQPPNTVGMNLPPSGVPRPPDPVYSQAMREQMAAFIARATPQCEVCIAPPIPYATVSTPIGVLTCGWTDCTLFLNVSMTRLVSSGGGFGGGIVTALLGAVEALFLTVMAAAITAYVVWMATEAVARTPDGCFVIRWTHLPLPSGIPTWIGHTHAANSKCHGT